MRTSTILTVALFTAFPVAAWGQHDHSQHNQSQHGRVGDAPAKSAPAAVKEQKTCPVSGKPAKDSVSASVNGEDITFCCSGCIDIYKADPDKYAPALYKQIHPQRVQVRCPVMGGQVDPEVFIEHKGEKVYFCCRGCDGKFEKDPAKYAAGMKKAYTDQVHCPVTGQAIDPQYSVKAAGGDVYFCSSECADKFKAEPTKYAAETLPAVGLLARGETARDDLVRCPVCPPENVHKRGEVKTIVRDGKAHFLSSNECERQFQANPAKSVKKLEEKPKSPARGGCCPH